MTPRELVPRDLTPAETYLADVIVRYLHQVHELVTPEFVARIAGPRHLPPNRAFVREIAETLFLSDKAPAASVAAPTARLSCGPRATRNSACLATAE